MIVVVVVGVTVLEAVGVTVLQLEAVVKGRGVCGGEGMRGSNLSENISHFLTLSNSHTLTHTHRHTHTTLSFTDLLFY